MELLLHVNSLLDDDPAACKARGNCEVCVCVCVCARARASACVRACVRACVFMRCAKAAASVESVVASRRTTPLCGLAGPPSRDECGAWTCLMGRRHAHGLAGPPSARDRERARAVGNRLLRRLQGCWTRNREEARAG